MQLRQAHSQVSTGNFTGGITTHKRLWPGLWWPTLFHNAKEFVKHCGQHERFKPPNMYEEMPLCPIMSTWAFSKWGLEFVGPIKSSAKGSHVEYTTIVTINYLTKWVEARATP